MKRTPKIDPLEETMENPDLPPLAVAAPSPPRAAARPARRYVRRTLALGALLLAGLFVALRLITA